MDVTGREPTGLQYLTTDKKENLHEMLPLRANVTVVIKETPMFGSTTREI